MFEFRNGKAPGSPNKDIHDVIELETLLENNHQHKKSKSQKSVYIVIFLLLVSYIVLDLFIPSERWGLAFESSSEEFTPVLQKSSVSLTLVTEVSIPVSVSTEEEDISTEEDSLNAKAACRIPKLHPFDKVIQHLVKDPDPVNCNDEEGFPLLFESTFNSSLVFTGKYAATNETGNFTSCCYKTVRRELENDDDNSYSLSNNCTNLPIEENSVTLIPPEDEFLVITCKYKNETSSTEEEKDMDMHTFIHEKSKAEERIKSYYETVEKLRNENGSKANEELPLLEKDKLNVVVLGLDATSHMNFIRFMPETYSYLKQDLAAIEMQGLNKVGDNTFPIMSAGLTGQNNTVLLDTCAQNKSFESCPFIWKEYASTGYRTFYGEDSTWMGIFNYQLKGFGSSPTDYYLRPFGVAAEALIGNHRPSNARLCYGPRLTFEVLLDYMKKSAFFMGHDKRYFQVIWATSLTHDYLNFPKLGDKQLLSTLKWFKEENYLNNTVFILMSDHGIRWGEIHEFLQGQLEDRLPFLFYVFPEWFKQKYSRAYENMKTNQDSLTTHFDLHEVLYDLHNLTRLTPKVIEERERELEEFNKNISLPRGISQFLPIPLSRKCQEAEISEHFCTCHRLKKVSKKKPEITQAANYIVYHVNSLISNYAKCAYLTLGEIKTAHLIESDMQEIKDGDGYQLTIVTKPGEALFEASVIRNKDGAWGVSGVITRTNLYGNQSHCVDEKELKLYCYCIDGLKRK